MVKAEAQEPNVSPEFVVGSAWAAYKKNFKPLLAALLLVILITGVPVLLGLMPIMYVYGQVEDLQLVTPESALAVWVFLAVMMLASVILGFVLQGGLITVCRDALKGKASAWSLFAAAKKRWKTYIGVGLLVTAIELLILLVSYASLLVGAGSDSTLLVMVGVIIFFVGYIALLLAELMLFFSYPAAVVDNLGAVAAVKSSYRLARRKLLSVFALNILLSIVMFAIALIAFVILSAIILLLVFLISMVYPLFTMPLIVKFYIAFIVGLLVGQPVIYLGLVSFYTRNKNTVKTEKTAKMKKRR